MTKAFEQEPETSVYAALRNRDKELASVRELLSATQRELVALREAQNGRLTEDKYEPPRVAREFGRYRWTQHGMLRETTHSQGMWTWCSVADILAFEDERAGMIARIDVLQNAAHKGSPEKVVMPRYKGIPFADDERYLKSRAAGYNDCIADWFKLNPNVETTIAPEVKA